jgi:hypothetical protein
MFTQRAVFYPHKRNSDGSFDSICLNCFTTIASARTEQELLESDKRHICKPSALSQRTFNRKIQDGR